MGETVMWLGDIEPDVIDGGSRRYWFVIDSENGWWVTPQKMWVEENSRLVEAWYLRTREDLHLRVYLYDPNQNTAIDQHQNEDVNVYFNHHSHRWSSLSNQSGRERPEPDVDS
jgi:hypothetical protein